MTQECKKLRKMLRRKAQQYGAELLCLKKAHMFQQWLSVATERYVLFTDWREVKHCIEAVALQGPEGRPMFTSVFCIDTKQQCRADHWVSTLAARTDPIYINGSLSFAESTVMSLLQQASKMPSTDVRVPSMSTLSQRMNGDAQMSYSLQPTKNVVQATQGPTERRTDVSILPLFELTQPKNDMQAHSLSQRTQLTKQDVPVTQLKNNQIHTLSLCVMKTADNPTAAVGHANPEVTNLQSKVSAHIAWIWKSLASATEVEKALLAAMPESYEE